jgi:hypothetical protein
VAAAQEDVEAVIAHGRVDTSSGTCLIHWGSVSRCVVDVFGFALFDAALTLLCGESTVLGRTMKVRRDYLRCYMCLVTIVRLRQW